MASALCTSMYLVTLHTGSDEPRSEEEKKTLTKMELSIRHGKECSKDSVRKKEHANWERKGEKENRIA